MESPTPLLSDIENAVTTRLASGPVRARPFSHPRGDLPGDAVEDVAKSVELVIRMASHDCPQARRARAQRSGADPLTCHRESVVRESVLAWHSCWTPCRNEEVSADGFERNAVKPRARKREWRNLAVTGETSRRHILRHLAVGADLGRGQALFRGSWFEKERVCSWIFRKSPLAGIRRGISMH